VQLVGGGVMIFPVFVGLTILPFQVVEIQGGETTAVATYYNAV
jgi:hypothetical protein